MLREQGVHYKFKEPEQSGGEAYEQLTVFLGSGGALSVLVHVLHKFLELRRERSIHVETADGVKVITTGVSVEEFERVLRSTLESGTESSQSQSPDGEPPQG